MRVAEGQKEYVLERQQHLARPRDTKDSLKGQWTWSGEIGGSEVTWNRPFTGLHTLRALARV